MNLAFVLYPLLAAGVPVPYSPAGGGCPASPTVRPAAITSPGIPAREQSTLRLGLNLPSYRLEIFNGDSLLGQYRVAIGDTAHPTPVGLYEVTRVEWDPWWIPPASDWAVRDTITPPGPANPMGRVRFPLRELYFIHGSPYDGSLGTPASHGCIRLSNADAIALARTILRYAAPSLSQAAIDSVARKRASQTRIMQLELSVRVEVRYETVEMRAGKLVLYPDVYRRTTPASETATAGALLQEADSTAHFDTLLFRSVVERPRSGRLTLDPQVFRAAPPGRDSAVTGAPE